LSDGAEDGIEHLAVYDAAAGRSPSVTGKRSRIDRSGPSTLTLLRWPKFERDVLRERTIAGMHAAKNRGEHIGRPPALKPSQVREARTMLARGETPSHVARVLRVGRSTLYRAIAKT